MRDAVSHHWTRNLPASGCGGEHTSYISMLPIPDHKLCQSEVLQQVVKHHCKQEHSQQTAAYLAGASVSFAAASGCHLKSLHCCCYCSPNAANAVAAAAAVSAAVGLTAAVAPGSAPTRLCGDCCLGCLSCAAESPAAAVTCLGPLAVAAMPAGTTPCMQDISRHVWRIDTNQGVKGVSKPLLFQTSASCHQCIHVHVCSVQNLP